MKTYAARAFAFGCFLLFANMGGSPLKPIIIEAKWEWIEPEPEIDEYIYEPEIEPLIFTRIIIDETPEVDYKEYSRREYIQKYSELASGWKVPAGIKLAQGILESDSGNSQLARENNNHFGIKCFSRSCKEGHCTRYTDDSHKDFFRKYKTVKDCYAAHDHFLNKPRYSVLFKIPYNDKRITRRFTPYVEGKKVDWYGTTLQSGRTYTFTGKEWWAIELCATGYATSNTYATKLDKLIKKYGL